MGSCLHAMVWGCSPPLWNQAWMCIALTFFYSPGTSLGLCLWWGTLFSIATAALSCLSALPPPNGMGRKELCQMKKSTSIFSYTIHFKCVKYFKVVKNLLPKLGQAQISLFSPNFSDRIWGSRMQYTKQWTCRILLNPSFTLRKGFWSCTVYFTFIALYLVATFSPV